MPEVKAADYTTGELTSAANACRDAVALLTPTADELMRISAEVELPDEELHFARTSRHVNAAALHLKISEATIRRITKNVGRTYDSILSRLYLLALAGSLTSAVLGLLRLLISDSIGWHLDGLLEWPVQYGMGFAGGAFLSIATLKSRIGRQPRDQ